MHKIEKIKVTGFWGNHEIEVPIFPDVTFFIGVNGTGKTTFINLVAASLVGDFAALEKMPFATIEITLSATSGGKKPSILVTKGETDDKDGIRYSVKNSRSGPEKLFSLNDLNERLNLRGAETSFFNARLLYPYYSDAARRPEGLAEAIEELVQVSWLSIHRTANPPRTLAIGEKNYESTVDHKLAMLSADLGKYLSSVSKQKDEEVRQFQEFIFLSLLDETKQKALTDPKGKERIPLQRDALIEIFKELHVPENEYRSRVEKYFRRSETIFARLSSDGANAFAPDELSNLIGLLRLNSIIERWRALQDRLAEIFQHRDKFLDTVDHLFQKKQLKISEENEIFCRSDSGKKLSLAMLSSGEKQLLILLAEALLQRGRPSIYIADEPELSLHVSWQEKLIPSIRTLNGSAQIIAATHSPDIVGRLSEHAIDMETLVK